MQIVVSQIPHRYRNRFLNNSGSVTVNKTSASNSAASNSFYPVNIWGQYFDDTDDIKGDFVSESNVSIGGNLYVNSSVNINDYVEIEHNASVGGDFCCNSSVNVKGRLSVGGLLMTHNLEPSTPTAYNIGSDSSKYGSIYAVRNYVDYLNVTNDTSAGNIYPRTTATYNLGSESLKYQNIYGVNTNSVNVTATNVSVGSTLSAPVIIEIQAKLTELENMILDVSSRVGS